MMKRKKKPKGFTLIELIMILGILSTFLGFSLIKFAGYGKLQNHIDVDLFGNSLINFINNSKTYCRDNNIGGYIYFDTEKDMVSFNCSLQRIYTLPLPDKFKLDTTRLGNKIRIDNRGITADACTINYKDREGQIHSISICVGTAYAEFKQ